MITQIRTFQDKDKPAGFDYFSEYFDFPKIIIKYGKQEYKANVYAWEISVNHNIVNTFTDNNLFMKYFTKRYIG